MDSYEIGLLTGKIIFWIIAVGAIWGAVILYKKLKQKLFSNPAKELLKEYLWWGDFVQGITSTEEFKKRLKKIKNKKVYKDAFNGFYLTQHESKAYGKGLEEVTVKEVLKSATYPLFLLRRLERITLYDKKDLKNITKHSKMVWITKFDIHIHMFLNEQNIIYPIDFPKDNNYRFGYEVFADESGLQGVYDIEADTFALDFKYKYISCFGNIIEVSKNNQIYEVIDLETKEVLSSKEYKTFPDIPQELKEKINFSKIELMDYLKLFDTPTSQTELIQMGLWGAKVGVMEVPSGYEDILEDSSIGRIKWNQYSSADIFDMSIELPVNFKKKNGEYVSLGIEHKYLVLDKEYRDTLKNVKLVLQKEEKTNKINSFEDLLIRGNLPDDTRAVPNYLKIKNAQYDDVNFSNNTVDELIKLSSDEFNELVSQTDNGLLFTWLSTLSDVELQRFYDYNDKVVKLENGAEESSKEQFENAMASINKEEITNTQRARATLEMPLAINYAKELYIKTITCKIYRTYDFYEEYKDEEDARFEVTLSNIIWDEMKYIPEYFEQVLTLYRDTYDEKSEYQQKIFKHLAARFGALIATLNRIATLTQTKQDSLNWFTGEMIKKDLVPPLEISVSQTKKLESDKKLINFLTLMYAGICDEDDEHYISNLIEVVYTLFEWYPANSDACEYALKEMLKSVALKNISVESANRFLEFFEDLPRFYKVLSYEKIMSLKELINHTLATYKLLNNKVFEKKGVKNKLILLNYKIDMEDLYYESTQNNMKNNSTIEAFFKNSRDEQIQEFLKTIEMERFVLLLDDYPPFVKQRVLENVTARVAVWIEEKIQRARENPMDADAKEEFLKDMDEIIKK